MLVEPKPKTKTTTKKVMPPCCQVGRSRSQVPFRMVFCGAGQTTAIPYGKIYKYADEHAALIVAREWVIALKKNKDIYHEGPKIAIPISDIRSSHTVFVELMLGGMA